jgi:hypothetical protein
VVSKMNQCLRNLFRSVIIASDQNIVSDVCTGLGNGAVCVVTRPNDDEDEEPIS